MILHEIENNPDSQSFLDENSEKLNKGCKKVLELLYKGERLNGILLVQKYGLDSRRLRDVISQRPDVVKKMWKRNESGKRLYMEYFIELPPNPTKAKAIEWASEYLERKEQLKQQSLF